MTELPEEKKTLAKLLSLRTKVKKSALQLEIKDLKVRGGIVKLKDKLDKAFSKDKKNATYDDYEKSGRFKPSNEVSFADYTREFEGPLYCLEKYKKTSSCCTSMLISQQYKPYKSPKYHC